MYDRSRDPKATPKHGADLRKPSRSTRAKKINGEQRGRRQRRSKRR